MFPTVPARHRASKVVLMSASKLHRAVVATGCCVLLFFAVVEAQFWPQWSLNAQHTGAVPVAGQAIRNILASITYDPLVADEMAATGGDLLAHYQVPLID